MAKATPVYVALEPPDPGLQAEIGEILRGEHGTHGLRFLGGIAGAASTEGAIPVKTDAEADELHLQVKPGESEIVLDYEADGVPVSDTIGRDIQALRTGLSLFVLGRLGMKPEDQSSRDDYMDLQHFTGIRPNLEADTAKWVAQNPFIAELCEAYPQYGNVLRFAANQRGMFMKAANFSSQRAYWNSTLNGGLPAWKKSDPIHEGTFMLHDVFHFMPADPLPASGKPLPTHKPAYIAQRMLSEASTLVLADMVAVADSRLQEQGYNISRRKIYPVYESIVAAQAGRPDVNKLLAANAYFCFTGDTAGFEALGASEKVLADYKEKYASIFRDDFMWNLHNYESMQEERASNPRVDDYYRWLAENTALPMLDTHAEAVATADGQVDIPKLLAMFSADFAEAFNYQEPLDDTQRLKLAYQKYLAGQRITFARFGGEVDADELQQDFDEHYAALNSASSSDEITALGQAANQAVDRYIDQLAAQKVLIPHEAALYRFSAPTYPIRFVNYDRKQPMSAEQLLAAMGEFMHVNDGQLNRLLEITRS